MGSRRRYVAGGLAAAALTTATLASPVDAAPVTRTLVGGLSSPKGIAIDAFGAVIVAQGAFGPPGPVIAYDPTAPKPRDMPVTDPFNLVDVAISPLDGTGWGLGSGDATGILFHQLEDGTIVEVLDLNAYQAGDPDPVDIDQPPFPEESNAYGLTIAPNGDALVADAAGNDIVRVTPDGVATTVARFGLEVIATDHLPDIPEFEGIPAEIPSEAVPTSVTIGPDGAIYVGELQGFPFRPGTSQVWRIEPDADGALCSLSEPSEDCTVYQDDLTAIQDIAFSTTRNRLYVYELAADGVLAFEGGFATGDFPPAVLIEIRGLGRFNERRVELAAGKFSQPGGVAVGVDGKIYVTDQVFAEFGGRLSLVVT